MTLFLDTNVPLYAAGREHELREPCRRVLEMVADGVLDVMSDAEVLQELLYIYWRRGEGFRARSLVKGIVEILGADRVAAVEARDVVRASELLAELGPLVLSPRDCIHLAVMEREGVREILSVDGDFDRVDWVVRVEPQALAREVGGGGD